MGIRFECISCGKKIVVHDRFAGRQIKCPACEFALKVPASTAAANGTAVTAPKPQAETSGNEVAHLGAQLFGRHLFAVEVAGVLLLVALVGAIGVVSRGEATEADHGREDR
jgi:hypothetical protein